MNFSEKIKKLRNDKKMSQEEFSRFIGIKRSTLSNYEQGRNLPVNEILVLIANKCNVPIEYLIDDEIEEYNTNSKNLTLGYVKDGKNLIPNVINYDVELEKLGITSDDLDSLSPDAKEEIKKFVEFIRSKYGKEN